MVLVATGDVSGAAWNPSWLWRHAQRETLKNSRLRSKGFGQHFFETLPGWDMYGFPHDNLDYDDDSEEDLPITSPGSTKNHKSPSRLLWDSSGSHDCGCHCMDPECSYCDIKSDCSDASDIDVGDPNGFWIKELHLKNSDKAEILNGDMLSDKHIFAAQKLLNRQFPHIEGFQDSCLSQTAFCPIHGDSVQIHHTRGNHWVTTSWTAGDVVEVYDSVYYTVTEDLLKQMNEIYVDAPRDANGNVFYRICDIPKQRGSKDCALFAAAVAYELCQGYDVTDLTFKQKVMRKHFVKCLEQRRLEGFPSV